MWKWTSFRSMQSDVEEKERGATDAATVRLCGWCVVCKPDAPRSVQVCRTKHACFRLTGPPAPPRGVCYQYTCSVSDISVSNLNPDTNRHSGPHSIYRQAYVQYLYGPVLHYV